MRRLFPVVLGLLLTAPVLAAAMDEEIDYLLATVRESDCTFIRNGKRYAAVDAADHLQTKRKRGKRYFESADEFIEKLASKSSMSGKPYMIQCGDADEVPSREWFSKLLAAYRQRPA